MEMNLWRLDARKRKAEKYRNSRVARSGSSAPLDECVISALPWNFPGFARGTIAQAPGRDPNEIGEMSDDAKEETWTPRWAIRERVEQQ